MMLSQRSLPMRKWLIILALSQIIATGWVLNDHQEFASQQATPEVLEAMEKSNILMEKKLDLLNEFMRYEQDNYIRNFQVKNEPNLRKL